MAVPQRHAVRPATPRLHPERANTFNPTGRPGRRKASAHRRSFLMLVVLPILLMLGSVYLHTVSADLADRVATLEERYARAAAEKENLDVRVFELSAPGRIRTEAQALGMREPNSKDLKVYEIDGEEGIKDGGERAQKNGR